MKRPGWIVPGLLALAGLGFAFRLLPTSTAAKPPAPRPPVPVLAATATTASVPERITAIGTVQAYNTVSIRPQVDGEITRVFFTQGQAVAAGAKLFEIDPRPYRAALDQAEAVAARDRATLAGAQADLARYASLVHQHYTPAKTYQDQRATVAGLAASVKLDEAAIESARLNLDHAIIRAPIAGRTGAILVNKGNVVQASQAPTLVTIAETQPIYVRFAVPEADLATIRAHQTGSGLAVAALAPQTGRTIATGHLAFIDNIVDAATGTITLMGRFTNADEALWPGEYVTARLTLAIQRAALTIPQAAIVEGPDGDYVYVIGADHTVRRRAVRVARIADDRAIIAAGLAPGTSVVSDGQFRLFNGAHVTIDHDGTSAAPTGPAP